MRKCGAVAPSDPAHKGEIVCRLDEDHLCSHSGSIPALPEEIRDEIRHQFRWARL